MMEVMDLTYLEYLLLRRDAFIYRISKTKEGIEYLKNAYLNEQTEPDRAGLRRMMEQMGQA